MGQYLELYTAHCRRYGPEIPLSAIASMIAIEATFAATPELALEGFIESLRVTFKSARKEGVDIQ